jgi:hypothetical protein
VVAGLKVGFNEGVMGVKVVGFLSTAGSPKVVVGCTGDGLNVGSALAEKAEGESRRNGLGVVGTVDAAGAPVGRLVILGAGRSASLVFRDQEKSDW